MKQLSFICTPTVTYIHNIIQYGMHSLFFPCAQGCLWLLTQHTYIGDFMLMLKNKFSVIPEDMSSYHIMQIRYHDPCRYMTGLPIWWTDKQTALYILIYSSYSSWQSLQSCVCCLCVTEQNLWCVFEYTSIAWVVRMQSVLNPCLASKH